MSLISPSPLIDCVKPYTTTKPRGSQRGSLLDTAAASVPGDVTDVMGSD